MKKFFSRLVRRERPAQPAAPSIAESREQLARIEAQLARAGERLESLNRIERQLVHSGAQLDFLHTHGASYLGDGIALTHLPDETPIFINSNDYGSPMNFLSGGRYEEDNLALLLSFVDDGTVFVDVGANLGFFSLRIAQRLKEAGGRVLAFEPQPAMMEMMRRTLHLNGLSEAVELHPFALSDRNGTTVFEVPVSHRGGAHIPSALTRRWQSKREEPTESREIELRTFDSVVPADFACDLVKIDVEGHELEVLRGMRGVLERSPRAGVLFEKMVRDYGNERALWSLFQQLGMQVYGVGDEATLRPFRTPEALIAWDRGYAFASRDAGLMAQARRRRFRASARQLRAGGEAHWPQGRNRGAPVEVLGRDALIFGPYWSLPRGQWRVTLDGEVDRPIEVLIKERVGLLEVARLRLEPGQRSVEFHCDRELVKFECVLHAIDRQPTRLHLRGLDFERTDGSVPIGDAAPPLPEWVPENTTEPVLSLPDIPPRADPAPRALVRPMPQIRLFSNCQGEVIASAIQTFTGGRMPKVQAMGQIAINNPSLLLGPLRELARTEDTILMQPILAKLALPVVPELADRIQLFPSLSFSAFHPDICYVFRRGLEYLDGPLGVYHSSIAYHAWRVGMSARQALDHFHDEVYEALRFYDYWDASVRSLCEEGREAGLPLEGLLERWRQRGCFMHSHNHPVASTLVDVARALLERMGVEVPDIDPAVFLHDPLASGPVWPVYPEIAARLGVAGSTTFKASNGNQDVRTPIRLFDLEAFVEQSFEAFETTDRETSRSDRAYSARYAEVFGKPARSRGRVVVEERPKPPAAEHPYAGLPARQFWRDAVAGLPLAEVDPVSPRFQLEPTTCIATAGSCFAQNISRALMKRGCAYLVSEPAPADIDAAAAQARQYGIYSARYGNLYTARQLLQLLRRANGDFVPAEAAWQRSDGRWSDPFRPSIEPEGFAKPEALEADRTRHLAAVRTMFATLEVFVFTLGLTEAWVSEVDGAVFPIAPGVIAGRYEPDRHRFVNFSVEEVVADLQAFVDELRALNPAARLLLTVSPVPLAATFEDRHVLASTVHSKSVLRAAAETVTRSRSGCDYFPSYEIVSGHHNRGAYYGSDLRTVTRSGVDQVMRLFFKHYLPAAPEPLPDAELLAELGQVDRLFCEEERLSKA